MKTGISLSGFSSDGSGYARIKNAGFDCVDYDTLVATSKHPAYALNDGDFQEYFIAEREKIRQAGLEVSQTHGPWRYPAQDTTEEDRAERFEKMCRAIYATKLLGCKHFVIHPIMPFGAESDENPDELWQMNLEFMSRLARVGEEHGVIVCLENMPMLKLPISKPEHILKLVKAVNSPWLRICLDTGHVAAHNGCSPADAVRLIGKEYLAVLHIHDNDGSGDLHWLPFTGIIDWNDFRSALQEIDFDGVVSIETSISENAHLPESLLAYEEKGLCNAAKYIAGQIN